jgi:hypothetical protein
LHYALKKLATKESCKNKSIKKKSRPKNQQLKEGKKRV